MLITAKSIIGNKLNGNDWEIGTVKELDFDDEHWTVRYLVAATGSWLADRQVLISPYAVTAFSNAGRAITVNLRKKQIEESPSLETGTYVSRKFEDDYYGYYGWPRYWCGPYAWGKSPSMARNLAVGDRNLDKWIEATARAKDGSPQILARHEVIGHRILAEDGEVGVVEDFLIDDETWSIRYLIVETRNSWPGQRVLLSPAWIDRSRDEVPTILVGLSLETIRTAPAYTDGSHVTREYEDALHRHYSRKGYWAEEPDPQVLKR